MLEFKLFEKSKLNHSIYFAIRITSGSEMFKGTYPQGDKYYWNEYANFRS